MRIGLDLDGVVCDWQQAALDIMEERGYPHMSVDDWIYWDWLKDQVKPKDWKWLWDEGVRLSYQLALPYPGAVLFAHKLKKLGNLVILTSRPEGAWRDTIDWWYGHMHFSPDGFNFFKKGDEKGIIPCDYLIEDNNIYAMSYMDHNPNATVILLERPWNNQGPDSELIRASTYEDVLNVIRLGD